MDIKWRRIPTRTRSNWRNCSADILHLMDASKTGLKQSKRPLWNLKHQFWNLKREFRDLSAVLAKSNSAKNHSKLSKRQFWILKRKFWITANWRKWRDQCWYLKNRNLFQFNQIFWFKFFKIAFTSILMGIFFEYLISFFENQLAYDFSFKSFYLILSVLLGLFFYLMVSYLIKAFNYQDLQLKY